MNMWGLTPEFFGILESGFAEFLDKQEAGNLKGEYLLPTIIGDLLEKDQGLRLCRSQNIRGGYAR